MKYLLLAVLFLWGCKGNQRPEFKARPVVDIDMARDVSWLRDGSVIWERDSTDSPNDPIFVFKNLSPFVVIQGQDTFRYKFGDTITVPFVGASGIVMSGGGDCDYISFGAASSVDSTPMRIQPTGIGARLDSTRILQGSTHGTLTWIRCSADSIMKTQQKN